VANIWFKHQHLKLARKEAEKWVGCLYLPYKQNTNVLDGHGQVMFITARLFA
jgi:hypothetical protein